MVKYTKYTNYLLFSLILLVVFFMYIIQCKPPVVHEGYAFTFPKETVPTHVAPVSDAVPVSNVANTSAPLKDVNNYPTEHAAPPSVTVPVAATPEKPSSILYSAVTNAPRPKRLRTIIP